MIVSTAYFSPQSILHLKWFVPYQPVLSRSCVWSVHLPADSPPNTWQCHQGHFPCTASLGRLLRHNSLGISLLIHSIISQLPCPHWPAWVLLGRGTVLPGFCKCARVHRQGQRSWPAILLTADTVFWPMWCSLNFRRKALSTIHGKAKSMTSF